MSAETYFSPAELEAIQMLPRDAPYAITPVIGTMLSIGRYEGIFMGAYRYRYIPAHDILIRSDVDSMITAARKLRAKMAREEQRERAKAAQAALL